MAGPASNPMPRPRSTSTTDFAAGAVKAYVKPATAGAALTFSTCLSSSTPWIKLTIAAGTTSVVAASDQIDALTPTRANHQPLSG